MMSNALGRRVPNTGPLMPVFFALLLGSCAAERPLLPLSEGAAESPTSRIIAQKMQAGVPPSVNGRIARDPQVSGRPVIRQDGSGSVIARPPPDNYLMERGDVSLNYIDTDVLEIARLILGDILKTNYTVDPGFRGMVTIQTPRPLKREELLGTLQGLVVQAGGTMTYQNGIFRIGSAGDDTVLSPLVDESSVGDGSRVVSLRFASARQLAALLEPYIAAGAKIIVDPTRNVLIVSGSAPARQNIVDLIRVFDVDYLAGQSYALFPANSGEPAKLVADLEAALRLSGDSPLVGVLKILPIKEANAIMVIAQQPIYIDRISRLIAQFDAIKERAGRAIHVYYLKNVQATDLQPILQRAVNPPTSAETGEIAPGNLPPNAEPAQIATPINASTPAGIGASANSPPMRSGATVAGSGALPPTSDSYANQQSSGKPYGPQIIADRSTSALIIVATESEYAMIEPAIRKLDRLPMQVLIEATVAEVTLNDSLQYGTQFFLRNHEGQATLSNALSPAPIAIDPSNPLSTSQLLPGLLAPSFPGLAIARTVGQEQFLLQALKDITDVQIISAPRLLILDKQQASFQVGELVPTITQTATSVITAGAPVVNSIQYQATGVILNVTPSINFGGLVTLDIEQEVSDVVPTTTSSINSPTFQQRKIKTKVVVQDGETISLAGLISDKKFKGNSGIPFLGTLPVVGALFSTRDNSTARTELLILLTPRVLYDQRDARSLTDELRQKLAPGRLVP